MKMDSVIGKGVSYDPLLTKDKYYFGGYFNLVDNNIKLVFKEFEEKLNLNINGNTSNKIDTYFSDTISLSDWNRRIGLLSDYLPFVTILDYKIDESPVRDSFRKELKLIIDQIEAYRNYFTHFYHNEIEVNDDLVEILKRIFIKAVNQEKRHRSRLKEFSKLKLNFEKEINSLSDETPENYVISCFDHLILDEKKSKFYSLKDGGKLSKIGILLLLGITLSKREMVGLLSNTAGFKATNELKYMATRWVFTHFCFKGIKKSLRSQYSDEALLMQIIDELTKCPHELFMHLSQEGQDEFLVDITKYFRYGGVEELEDDEELAVPIIRKRYWDQNKHNKFVYFALRYLDTYVEFPTLRFQIHAGNYIHNVSKKMLSSELEANRITKEKINVFARLDEITKAKEKYFETQIQELNKINDDSEQQHVSSGCRNDSNSWEIFPLPSYNLVDNNIPIYIQGVPVKNVESNRKAGKVNKSEIIKKVFDSTSEYHIGKPNILISVHELPSLLYQILVLKKTGEEVEKIIKDKASNHIKRLKDKSCYNDYKDEIPRSLLNHSIHSQLDKDKLNRRIETDREWIKKQYECLEKVYNKMSEDKKQKYPFSKKEIGEIGVLLSNDMKQYFSPSTKAKWKGYQHSELQLMIAFFKDKRPHLLNMLQSCFDKKSSYREKALIKTIEKSSDLLSFFSNYLKYKTENLNYLERRIKKLEIQTLTETEINSLISEIYEVYPKRDYYNETWETQLNRILDHPINLNRGIFDDKPTYINGKNYEDNKREFAEWYVYAKDQLSEMQSFYNFELVTSEKDNKLDIYQKLSKIKIEDVYMRDMARSLFKLILNNDYNFSLKEIFLTKYEIEKQRKSASTQKNRQPGDVSENVYNEDNIWNKKISMSIAEGRIKEDNLALKDVGKFRQLEIDDRVDQLLAYDSEKIWNRDEIMRELDSYEKIRREELLMMVQDLEKQILIKSGWTEDKEHPQAFLQGKYPNFKKYILNGDLDLNLKETDLEILNNLHKLDDNNFGQMTENGKKAYLIIMIRNKFAHNQLIHERLLHFSNLNILKKDNVETYAEYLKKSFVQCMKSFGIDLTIH